MTEPIASLTVDNTGARTSLAELRQDFAQVGAAVESNTRRLANYGRDFGAIARQLGVYTDGVERHTRVIQAADRALKAADITREEHARIVAESAARYDAATRAAQENARTAAQQAQAQAALSASVDEVRRRYNATYRELQAFADETNRVTRLLEEANIAEEERARLLRQVAQAHDPAIRAARDQAAAVEDLFRQYDQGHAAQARYAAEQQRVVDLFLAGALNGRQFEEMMRRVAQAHDPAIAAARKDAEAFAALEDRLDRAGAAARRLAADQALLDQRRNSGELSPERHAALSRALNDQATAHSNAARTTSAHANAARILVPQLNDIFVQASMGTPVLQILTQQGPQIAEGFMVAGKEALLAAARFGLMAAPVLAIGAAIGVYESRAASIRDVERAFRLMGAGAAMTAGQVETLAQATATAGNVSVSAARGMVAEYTRVGQVAPAVMERVVAITRDYAALTGQDAAKATTELARLLRDPARGAAELADGINLLSGAMLDHVRRLSEAGRQTEAQRVLVDALAQRVKGAAEETSIWARAWHAVATGAFDALDGIGKVIDRAVNGLSLDEKIKIARDALAALRQDAAKPLPGPDAIPVVGAIGGNIGGARERAEQQRRIQQAEAELEKLRELQRERNQLGAVQQRDATNNAAGRVALDTARHYDELGETIRATEGDLARLNRGLGQHTGAAAATSAKALEGLKNRLDGLNAARTAGMDMATYKADQLAKAEQKAAGMGEQARAKYLAGERTRIELLDAAVTKTERQHRIDAAKAAVTAQQATATADATRALDAQTRAQELLAAAAGKGEAAQRRARLEAEVFTAAQKGLGEATRAALEAQEEATVRQLRGEQTKAITDQIAAQDALTAAIAKGPAAAAEAERATQAHALALREAEDGTAAFSAAYQHYLALLRDKATSEAATEVARLGDTLATARRQLEFRGSTAGLSEEQKAVAKAQADILDTFRAYRDEQGRLAPKLQQQLNTLLDQAAANAKLELSVKRQEDAWTQLGQVGERAFDRVGDALTEVFVSGQREAIDFGSLLRGILASITTDLVKMGAVAPLKNLIFGTSSPTLWDAVGVGGGAQGTGTGLSTGNLLSIGSKFIPESWTSGITNSFTSALNSFGSQYLGLSAGMSAVPASVTGAMGPVVAIPGTVSANAATGIAAAGNAGVANALYGSAGGASLSGILGGAGIGAVGGMLGGMLGNATGSKAVGGLSGAALGGIGTWALMGSAAGPIGIAAGAIIGGIMGILGTGSKPSNKEGGATINLETGRVAIGGQTGKKYSQENRDEAEKVAKQIYDLYGVMSGYAGGRELDKDIFVGVGDRDGIRAQYDGPANERTFSRDETGVRQLTAWFMERFAKELKDGFDPVLAKAIDNIDWSDAEKALKQVDIASNFTDTVKALAGNLGLEDATKKQAREAARAERKALEEWLETIEEMFPSVQTGGSTRTVTARESTTLSAAEAIAKGLITRETNYLGDSTYETVYRDLEGRIVNVTDDLSAAVTVWRDVTKTITEGGQTVVSEELAQAKAAAKAYVDNIVNAVEPRTYTEVEAAAAALSARMAELGPLMKAAGHSAAEIPALITTATANGMAKLQRGNDADQQGRLLALGGVDLSVGAGIAGQYAAALRNVVALHGEGARRTAEMGQEVDLLTRSLLAAVGLGQPVSALAVSVGDFVATLGLSDKALGPATAALAGLHQAVAAGTATQQTYLATIKALTEQHDAGILTTEQYTAAVGRVTAQMREAVAVATVTRSARTTLQGIIDPRYQPTAADRVALAGLSGPSAATVTAALDPVWTALRSGADAGLAAGRALDALDQALRTGAIGLQEYNTAVSLLADTAAAGINLALRAGDARTGGLASRVDAIRRQGAADSLIDPARAVEVAGAALDDLFAGLPVDELRRLRGEFAGMPVVLQAVERAIVKTTTAARDDLALRTGDARTGGLASRVDAIRRQGAADSLIDPARAVEVAGAALDDLFAGLPVDELRRLRGEFAGMPVVLQAVERAIAGTSQVVRDRVRAATDEELLRQRQDARAAYLSALEAEAEGLRDAARRMRELGASLRALPESLALDRELSVLNAGGRVTEAGRQLDQALARAITTDVAEQQRLMTLIAAARGGDTDADRRFQERLRTATLDPDQLQTIQALIPEFLRTSRDYHAADGAYNRDYQWVTGLSTELGSLADTIAGQRDSQADQLNRQITAMGGVVRSLDSTVDALTALRRATDDAAAVWQGLEAAGRDTVRDAGLETIRAAAGLSGHSYSGEFRDNRFGAFAVEQMAGSSQRWGDWDSSADQVVSKMLAVVTGYAGDFRDGAFVRYMQSGMASDVQKEAAREILRRNGHTPQFAAGGWHSGGARIVGEHGAELEVTGEARYYSAAQTRELLRPSPAPDLSPLARAVNDNFLRVIPGTLWTGPRSGSDTTAIRELTEEVRRARADAADHAQAMLAAMQRQNEVLREENSALRARLDRQTAEIRLAGSRPAGYATKKGS